MSLTRMPVFCWTAFAAQSLQLIGLPAPTGGTIMLLMDLNFGTSFYRAEEVVIGPPLLLLVLFPSGLCHHPAGLCRVFRTLSGLFRKPLFGYLMSHTPPSSSSGSG